MRTTTLNQLFARGSEVDAQAITSSAMGMLQCVFRHDGGEGPWLDPSSAEHDLLDTLLGSVHLIDDLVRLVAWQLWHPHHRRTCVVCHCESPPGVLTFLAAQHSSTSPHLVPPRCDSCSLPVHRCSHSHATRCSGSLFAAPAFGRLRRRRRSVELLRRAHFADANAVCEVCVESLEDQGWVLPASSSVSPPPAWTHSRSCDECRAFPVVGPLFRSMWPPSKADMSDNTTFTPRARALDGGRAASRTWRYVARRGSSWRPLSLCGGCSLPGV